MKRQVAALAGLLILLSACSGGVDDQTKASCSDLVRVEAEHNTILDKYTAQGLSSLTRAEQDNFRAYPGTLRAIAAKAASGEHAGDFAVLNDAAKVLESTDSAAGFVVIRNLVGKCGSDFA